MEADKLKQYLNSIEDFVFIEDKIVTCVWLCQVLKVHANTAKQLLHTFLQQDGNKEKVLVTYLIGGELKNQSGKQLKLVQDSARDSAKSIFSKVTTDHVYSIQKSEGGGELQPADLFNSNPHFLVNVEERRLCPVQSSQEIEKREIKVPVIETKKENVPLTAKLSKAAENNEVQRNNKNDTSSEPPSKEKHVSPEKNNKAKGKGGGIAGMFNRQAEKKKTEVAADKTESKLEKKKPGGISGFFQKQPAKKEESKPEPMEVDCDVPIKEANCKIDEKKKVPVQENGDDKNENQKSSIKEKKLKGKENRKKRKKRDEEKEDDPRKKRKRIVSILSSESESSENESEHEMEPEPPPAKVPVAEEEEEDIIPPTPGRKRIRKQIEKTYTDEDGFILTKKEYVYESCTDDEADVEKNEKKDKEKVENVKEEKNESKPNTNLKNDDKKTGKKKSPTKKQISPSNNKSNKQASIMNFFKRK